MQALQTRPEEDVKFSPQWTGLERLEARVYVGCRFLHPNRHGEKSAIYKNWIHTIYSQHKDDWTEEKLQPSP